MAEPLAVDPTRLIAAASKLTELVFPAPPAPIAVTGADSVSAAINQTMPGIESLVSDGLPGVTASLKRTATSMGTAADIYTKADQSLGQALTQYGFDAAGQSMGAGAADAVTGQSAVTNQSAAAVQSGASAVGAQLFGAPGGAAQQLLGASGGAASGLGQQVSEAVGAQAEVLQPRIEATVPQMVQLAPMAQQMAPMGQQVGQSVQQAASQASSQGGGASTAELASDTKPADDEAKDDEVADDGPSTDGAAAGPATLVSAPVQGVTGGEPAAGSAATPI